APSRRAIVLPLGRWQRRATPHRRGRRPCCLAPIPAPRTASLRRWRLERSLPLVGWGRHRQDRRRPPPDTTVDAPTSGCSHSADNVYTELGRRLGIRTASA